MCIKIKCVSGDRDRVRDMHVTSREGVKSERGRESDRLDISR